MTRQGLERQCRQVLYNLVNRGCEVCGEFAAKPESTYFCETCGYSQYIHLVKQIIELEN